MRVRLRADLDIERSEIARLKAWLHRDKEYVVLEISGAMLRVYSDNESRLQPLFPARHFDVTDGAIPPNWVAELSANGAVNLAPRRWLEPGFWETLDDDEEHGENLTWWQHVERRNQAEAAYDEELAIILG